MEGAVGLRPWDRHVDGAGGGSPPPGSTVDPGAVGLRPWDRDVDPLPGRGPPRRFTRGYVAITTWRARRPAPPIPTPWRPSIWFDRKNRDPHPVGRLTDTRVRGHHPRFARSNDTTGS